MYLPEMHWPVLGRHFGLAPFCCGCKSMHNPGYEVTERRSAIFGYG